MALPVSSYDVTGCADRPFRCDVVRRQHLPSCVNPELVDVRRRGRGLSLQHPFQFGVVVRSDVDRIGAVLVIPHASGHEIRRRLTGRCSQLRRRRLSARCHVRGRRHIDRWRRRGSRVNDDRLCPPRSRNINGERPKGSPPPPTCWYVTPPRSGRPGSSPPYHTISGVAGSADSSSVAC